MSENAQRRPVRWRWAVGILVLAAVALAVIWTREGSRQDHVIQTMVTGMVTLILLFLWAVLFSRFRRRVRLAILCFGILIGGGLAAAVEIKGVSGDLVPIFRWRWNKGRKVEIAKASGVKMTKAAASFPQFLGPDRNGVIRGITLETNWTAKPPQELWRSWRSVDGIRGGGWHRRDAGATWRGGVGRGLRVGDGKAVVDAY